MTKINFSKLEGKLGKAAKVAGYLKEVCGYDGKSKALGHKGSEPEAYEQLMLHLVGSNEWYSASAPAIDELLTNLAQGARQDIGLALVTDIACADHVRAWLASPKQARIPTPILEVLTKHRETVFKTLSDQDERARGAAAMLVGCVDGFGQEFRGELLKLLGQDSAPSVRASAALALGRVGEGDREVIHILAQVSMDAQLEPMVRGAAAIAWLRANPDADLDACAGSLVDWLSSSLRDESSTLHWFGAVWSWWKASAQRLTAPARALSVLARARQLEERVVQLALSAALQQTTKVMLSSVSDLVLDLGGFLVEPGKVTRTLSPSEFNPSQQKLLPLLARSIVPISASYGLPAAGANRRRWLGLEPPGPLERTYEELGDEPLWKACQSRTVELPVALIGLERWKAMIELCAAPYARLPDRSYQAELARLVVDPAWYNEISSVLDEVTSRGEIANLFMPRPIPLAGYLAEVALLPLLRAGLPLRDAWINHAWFPSTKLKPELLQLLPPSQREQLLYQVLMTGPDSCSVGHVKYVSMIPTHNVVRAAIRQVQGAGKIGNNPEPLLAHLTALIPEHPFVAEALREVGLMDSQRSE